MRFLSMVAASAGFRKEAVTTLALGLVSALAFGQDGPQPVSNVESRTELPLRGTSRSEQYVRGGIIRVTVPYSTRATLVTCVSFPEKSIRSIVAAWAESNVSLEHSGGNLFIKLLRESEGHIDVIGGSGRLYRLYISPATSGTYDETLQVTLPEETPASHESKPSAQVRSLALDLILAMRRGERPEGVLVSGGPQHAVHAGPDAELFIRLVYELDGFVGYVIELQNRSGKELSLDLSRYQGEGLLLIGAREMSVAPGASTLLYLVFAEEN